MATERTALQVMAEARAHNETERMIAELVAGLRFDLVDENGYSIITTCSRSEAERAYAEREAAGHFVGLRLVIG